jgi:predicted transcriptional regulator
VDSIKDSLHPNAYLKSIRNVRSGLAARSKILVLLEQDCFNASVIAKKTELSYGVVAHQLKLLKSEGTVERKGNRRFVWLLTGLGQRRLA